MAAYMVGAGCDKGEGDSVVQEMGIHSPLFAVPGAPSLALWLGFFRGKPPGAGGWAGEGIGAWLTGRGEELRVQQMETGHQLSAPGLFRDTVLPGPELCWV